MRIVAGRYAVKHWAWIVLVVMLGGAWIASNRPNSSSGSSSSVASTGKPYTAIPPSSSTFDPSTAVPLKQKRETYVKPLTAPNGQPWPSTSAYVKGYKKLHLNGLSSVTIDNSKNDSDVFVKLVSLDGPEAFPVRVIFLSAFDRFTLNKIRAGSYDIRYRDLDSGALSRSEPFQLEEVETYEGIQYSDITMTLYKVSHGNMETYGLSEAEF